MIFKIDYHFHPSLPLNKEEALEKCKRWWVEYAKYGINVLIVTEHIYENPKFSYEMMRLTRPKNCFVFPGVEYLTKEGIDIIIFSKKPDFYGLRELLPYKMTYKSTLEFVYKNKLEACVTHPYTLGNTSIIHILGYKIFHKSVDKLGVVEITNTSFLNLRNAIREYHLQRLLKKEMIGINRTMHLPHKDYPKKIKFLAAGSDAHYFSEVGTYVRLNCDPKDLFFRLTHDKNPQVIRKRSIRADYLLLLEESLNSFKEYMLKIKQKC